MTKEFEKQKSKNYENFHAIYQKVKKLGDSPHFSILDLICESENDDEKQFFTLLSNYFLQKKQTEIIEKKVF